MSTPKTLVSALPPAVVRAEYGHTSMSIQDTENSLPQSTKVLNTLKRRLLFFKTPAQYSGVDGIDRSMESLLNISSSLDLPVEYTNSSNSKKQQLLGSKPSSSIIPNSTAIQDLSESEEIGFTVRMLKDTKLRIVYIQKPGLSFHDTELGLRITILKYEDIAKVICNKWDTIRVAIKTKTNRQIILYTERGLCHTLAAMINNQRRAARLC